jgi:NADH:ubiquinone oxidoreductase subunit 5 (subunit L)/multisubunit Na+/H+ antiporter MnhA subunit
MSSPTSDFAEFFKKLREINSAEAFNSFCQQYWYALLIIGIIITGIIIINIAFIIIFGKRKSSKSSDKQRLAEDQAENPQDPSFKKTCKLTLNHRNFIKMN